MIIVNASPLVALTKVHRMDLFSALFGKVVIPQAVHQELTDHKAVPPDQRQQILEAVDTNIIEVLTEMNTGTFSRESLGPGERGVLNLALQYTPQRILIDDKRARNEARELGFGEKLMLTSTMLKLAAEQNLADYEDIMHRLRRHGIMLPE